MLTRQRIAPVLGLLLAALMGAPTAHAGSDCTCRAKDGITAREGETVCIATPSGRQMARCEKVLNNTSWRLLKTPCPSASLDAPPLSLRPAEPRGVALAAR